MRCRELGKMVQIILSAGRARSAKTGRVHHRRNNNNIIGDSAPPSSSLLATTGQATSASVLSLPRPYRTRTISTPFLDVFSIPNLVCKISYESLLFAETKTIIEKATTTTATRNCVVVSFILIIVVIVIKADMKRVKRV
jgi:hypothetical protein